MLMKEWNMFSWKAKKQFNEQARELSEPNANYSGANRRAINFMPVPMMHDGHEIAQTSSIRYHHLLISIEGNQRTCCIKVISPKKKARGALLIFRGRVLGSLYGRKNLDHHVFAQDAHRHVLSDLATAGNILDAYQLPEEMVLASASLFHGQILEFNDCTPAQTFEHAAHSIMSFGLPGCIVVSNSRDEMICMVYLAYGKIIGVYSSRDGWVENTHGMVMSLLNANADARVTASVMAIRSIDEVSHMGFSLTGLADRNYDQWRTRDNLLGRMPELEAHQLMAMEHYESRPEIIVGSNSAEHTGKYGRIERKVQHVHEISPNW